MLDPVVYAAFVTLVAWLLKLGAQYIGLELNDEIYNTLATALVALILAQLGVPAVRALLPGAVRRGLVSKE